MHAGATHAFELCCTVFLLDAEFRLLFPLCVLPSSVFLLNVASSSERLLFSLAGHRVSAECGPVFADLALYLAVGGLCLGLVELSCPLTPISCFKAAYLCVGLFTLSYRFLSLSQARQLEICNIEPGDCAAVCSKSGIGMFWTLLRVIIGAIRAYLCTCVVTAVFCATLISS